MEQLSNRDLRRRRHHRSANLLAGFLLTGFGVLFLLQNMGLLRFRDGLAWAFPILAIGWGIRTLIRVRQSFPLALAAIAIAFGALRILSLMDVFQFDRRYIPPMVLIGVGGAFLVRAISPQRPFGNFGIDAGESSDDVVRHQTLFGSVDKRVTCADFKGGELSAMFGGIKLDLRHATIPAGGSAALECNFAFGGMELRVPETWNVVVRSSNLFGGVNDETICPRDPAAPRLIIAGTFVFGGAAIKN